MGFGLWVLGWSHFAVKVTTGTRRRNGALVEFKKDQGDSFVLCCPGCPVTPRVQSRSILSDKRDVPVELEVA